MQNIYFNMRYDQAELQCKYLCDYYLIKRNILFNKYVVCISINMRFISEF